MGLYDMFGSSGDQLKIFQYPLYYYEESHYKAYKENPAEIHFLGYVGGQLASYPIGASVPYKDMFRKIPPDFIVLYGSFFENEPNMIFVFLDGKFTESIEEINEDTISHLKMLFQYVQTYAVLNYYGNRLNVTFDDILEYFSLYKAKEKANTDLMKKWKSISSILGEYAKADTNTDADSIKSKKKAARLAEAYGGLWDMVDIAREEINRPMMKFMIPADEIEKERLYEDFGAYLYLLGDLKISGDKLSCLKLEAGHFFNTCGIALSEYYKWNETPRDDRRELENRYNMALGALEN